MRWSVLLALGMLALAVSGVFSENQGDRCGRSTELAWTYCESVQPVRRSL